MTAPQEAARSSRARNAARAAWALLFLVAVAHAAGAVHRRRGVVSAAPPADKFVADHAPVVAAAPASGSFAVDIDPVGTAAATAATAATAAAAPEGEATLGAVTDWRECGGDRGCCARLLSPAGRAHAVREVRFGVSRPMDPGSGDGDMVSFPMAVYGGGDIVSGSILRGGAWDMDKTREVVEALAAVPNTAFLDVGANIGWFTLVAAAVGYNVTAVEPFAENRAALTHSLCLGSAAVRARVDLLPYGLHARDNVTCQLWQQPEVNRGDTISVCDSEAGGARLTQLKSDGYVKLGEASMRRLDSLIADGQVRFANGDATVVMKIDVEGFEPFAMAGANGFLEASTRPVVIYSEYSPSMIELAAQAVGESAADAAARPEQYLMFMRQHGYTAKESGTDDIREVLFTRG